MRSANDLSCEFVFIGDRTSTKGKAFPSRVRVGVEGVLFNYTLFLSYLIETPAILKVLIDFRKYKKYFELLLGKIFLNYYAVDFDFSDDRCANSGKF